MTGKERIQAAIEHHAPDRVPTLFGDTHRMGTDDNIRFPDGSWVDAWGTRCTPHDGLLYGGIEFPVSTIEGLREYRIPDPLAEERWQNLSLEQATGMEQYVLGCGGQTLFERMHFVVGMENCLAWLYEYPEEMADFADAIVTYRIAELDRWAALGVDGVFYGDDWGTQESLLVSPTLWHEIFQPRYARLFGHAHALGLSTWLHSCGHILDIIPGLADAGLDVIQSEQPMCMGLEQLTGTCYSRITLNSLPDIQTFLPFATPDEVRGETARLISLAHASEGWFIADTYGHWAEGIPPENVRAMEDTFRSWRF